MNSLLDDSLVTAALLVSAGYLVATLGPRSLRQRLLAASSRTLAKAPAFLGLGRVADKLAAAALLKAKGACGGCDNCGAAQTSASATTSTSPTSTSPTGAASSMPAEIKVPLERIGRRV